MVRRAAGWGHQHALGPLFACPVTSGSEGADAGRTKVGDGTEVDRHGCYARTAFDGDLAVQCGCGGRIDVAPDNDAAGFN